MNILVQHLKLKWMQKKKKIIIIELSYCFRLQGSSTSVRTKVRTGRQVTEKSWRDPELGQEKGRGEYKVV